MLNLRRPVTYQYVNLDPELWAHAWRGSHEQAESGWPTKSVCLQAGFRPLPRHIENGSVYAFCLIVDRTPDKLRWKRHRLWRGGPTIWELFKEGAEPVGVTEGALHQVQWDLEHRDHIVRSDVARANGESLRARLGLRPLLHRGVRLIREDSGELSLPEDCSITRRLTHSRVDPHADVVVRAGYHPVKIFSGR